MRTFPSRRENKMYSPVLSKKKVVKSLPVVEEFIYRPVPSGKIILNIYTAAAAAAPADRARHRQPAASSLQSVVGTSNRPPWMPFWSWGNVLSRLPVMFCAVSLMQLQIAANLPARSKGSARLASTGLPCRTTYLVHATYVQQHYVLISYQYVPTPRAMCYCCCSFAFEIFFLNISWRICRKRMKFAVSWPSLVSYQCLHAYAAMYCPTPCSLRLCDSCTQLNLQYLLLVLNAVCFFLQKNTCKQSHFVFFLHKTEFSIIRLSFFQKAGIFRCVPCFFCQGCLSRHGVDVVCQVAKVLSPDIFAPQ